MECDIKYVTNHMNYDIHWVTTYIKYDIDLWIVIFDYHVY